MIAVYGLCTGTMRNGPLVPAFIRIENSATEMDLHKIPLFQRALWWARQGLNLRPHPCEGCALPLSYAPVAVRHVFWTCRLDRARLYRFGY
jgi:hypothetical protein